MVSKRGHVQAPPSSSSGGALSLHSQTWASTASSRWMRATPPARVPSSARCASLRAGIYASLTNPLPPHDRLVCTLTATPFRTCPHPTFLALAACTHGEAGVLLHLSRHDAM